VKPKELASCGWSNLKQCHDPKKENHNLHTSEWSGAARIRAAVAEVSANAWILMMRSLNFDSEMKII